MPILFPALAQAPAFSAVDLVPWIAIFAIMYFLLIRPQRKADQERRAMQSSLQKNDRVVTQGGIIGVVAHTKDDEVVLRVDAEKNVRIRFQRASIIGKLGGGDDKDKEKDKDGAKS